MSVFSDIPSALDAYKRGEILCVMDDEDRENEGDLILAAEHATPERIGFIIRFTSGILCAPMLESRATALNLTPMVEENQDTKGTAFTVTCDAVGTTTGCGGLDRSFTFNQLAAPLCTAKDFVRPGHVFPLIAKDEGVLARRGHTEASTDLGLLSGCEPVAVIGELTNDDGTMMRLPQVTRFAERFGLKLITIEQMVQFREALGLTGALQRENASATAVAERLASKTGTADDKRVGGVPAYSAKQAGLTPANGRGSEGVSAADERKETEDPASPLGLALKAKFPQSVIKTLKIGIVRALWNDQLVSSLVTQTVEELARHGLDPDKITQVEVPGSYELPLAAQQMALEGKVDAIICIGLLVKPQTIDFECVSQSVSQGLMQVQLDTRVPVIYGVLNCLTVEQAQTRCAKGSTDARSLAQTALYQAYANCKK